MKARGKQPLAATGHEFIRHVGEVLSLHVHLGPIKPIHNGAKCATGLQVKAIHQQVP